MDISYLEAIPRSGIADAQGIFMLNFNYRKNNLTFLNIFCIAPIRTYLYCMSKLGLAGSLFC